MSEIFVETPIRRRVVIAFVILVVVFFIILATLTKVIIDVRNLSEENKRLVKQTAILTQENAKRIKEIQAHRIEGCVEIYEAIGEVFKPFSPEPPLTREQELEVITFRQTLKFFQEECRDPNAP